MKQQSLVFSIIGGDTRQRECIEILASKGHIVKAFGFKNICSNDRVKIYEEMTPELFDCDVLLLPIPYKDKNGYINFKEINMQIELEEILNAVFPSTIIILGKADEKFKKITYDKKIAWCDIVEEEAFSILNAIPTAEGAIQKAMEMTDITLHGAKVLILGYGRIGKSLSRMLKGIGSHVTVEARNYKDLAWIKENGYTPVHLKQLDSVLPDQDIIFNTVPHMILDRKKLELVSKRAVIIDLASYPGGVDFQAASDLGIRASLELGLPGIVAPRTAADIICSVMLDVIKQMRE